MDKENRTEHNPERSCGRNITLECAMMRNVSVRRGACKYDTKTIKLIFFSVFLPYAKENVSANNATPDILPNISL